MAKLFKKGDIVFHGNIMEPMSVVDVNNDKITCQHETDWHEDDLTLFSRPGITEKEIRQGEELGEYHLKDNNGKLLGYGHIYDCDGHSWFVRSNGDVFVAQGPLGNDEYNVFVSGDNILIAIHEDNDDDIEP